MTTYIRRHDYRRDVPKKRSKGETEILPLLAASRSTPYTAAEVARKLHINQKTAQTRLLDLAVDGKVHMKKMGRYRIYWVR